jgi:hypothetical protein
MSVCGISRDGSWPTEEVTLSSPGHKQKSGSTFAASPAKMAMPDVGMDSLDGKLGGEDGGGSGGGENGALMKGQGSPE